MASNRVLAKSINMPFLQSNNKFIYVSLLVVLSFFLLLDYVRYACLFGMGHSAVGVVLGVGLVLPGGQAHPKFNKKTQSTCCNTLL